MAVAKRHDRDAMANRRSQAHFTKEGFCMDVEAMTCTCSAGQHCRTVVSIGSGTRYGAADTPPRAFWFEAEVWCLVVASQPACQPSITAHG